MARGPYRKTIQGMAWCCFGEHHMPLGAFGTSNSRPNGVQPICNDCRAEITATSRDVQEVLNMPPRTVLRMLNHPLVAHCSVYGFDMTKRGVL